MTQASGITRKTLPPFPRLSGRLYIFPAFIPMIDLLPWLLTLVGITASATQLAFWKQHRHKVMAFAMVCFLGAGGVVWWEDAHRPSEVEGSAPVKLENFSKLTHIADLKAGDAIDKTYDSFAPLWTVETKNEPLGTPVMAGDLLLTGMFEGYIEARARTNGALLWTIKKHEPVFTNVVPLKDMAYVGEGLHTAPAAVFTAFSLPDGKPVWERQFRSHLESPALIDESGHRLWVGAGDESLWSLDTRDGSVLWRQKIGHIDATPLVNDGVLYTVSWPDLSVNKSKLYALDPDSGKTKWSVDLPGRNMGSPLLGPDGVILSTTAIGEVGPQKPDDAGWAHAVSPDGKLLWTVDLHGISLPEANVLVDKGIVIHTLKTGVIVALSIKDGSTLWSLQLGKEIDAPSALRADSKPPLLATITADGAVSLMNAVDGTEIRRFNVKEGGYAAPVFDHDILYISTPHSMTAYGGVHLFTHGAK